MKNILLMIVSLILAGVIQVTGGYAENSPRLIHLPKKVATERNAEIQNAATVSVEPGDISCKANTTGSFRIQINSGFYPVAAYNFTLSWTPGVIRIDSVQSGNSSYFLSPVANIDNATGMLTVSDFQASSLVEPTGSFSVATLHYTAGLGGSTNLDLAVNELKDTGGLAISHTTVDGIFTVEAIPTPTETPRHWPTAAYPRSDVNEDGYVDDKDLLMLRHDWHTWRLTPTPESE